MDAQSSSQNSAEDMKGGENPIRRMENLKQKLDGVFASNSASSSIDSETRRDENEYESAMARFMRNEMNYDEFMRLTGGQTIEEELGVGGSDDDEEIDVDGMDLEAQTEDISPTNNEDTVTEGVQDGKNRERQQDPIVGKRICNLPVFVRDIMDEIVTGDLATRIPVTEQSSGTGTPSKPGTPAFAPSPLPPSTAEQVAQMVKVELEEYKKDGKDRGKSKRMDALLGQANVIYARGNIEEAVEMLHEVIKQDRHNWMAYQQISVIYQHKGEAQRGLQYGLLAAHLDSKTPAEDWMYWGDECKKQLMFEEAAACYARAIRLDPNNWMSYERRIEMLDLLGLRPIAMKARLQAAQQIDHKVAKVDFSWFDTLIRTVAHYYITINDEEKAIAALEAFVLRSREFGNDAEAQHDTLIGMWMAKHHYVSAGSSILALCDGIKVVNVMDGTDACRVTYSNGTYQVVPFPPEGDVHFVIDDVKFSLAIMARLIICFIYLNKHDMAKELVVKLLGRDLSNESDEQHVLEIARAYVNNGKIKAAKAFLDAIVDEPVYEQSSFDYWFIVGNVQILLKNEEEAMRAFERVLSLNSSHVDSRITLSSLQQKAGMAEKALETLQDFDLDSCSHLPDERLLIRQADVLFDRKQIVQFVRTTRLLLAPHFYQVHRQGEAQGKKSRGLNLPLSHTLRGAALNAIQDTNWERLVKRLGAIAVQEERCTTNLDVTQMHDYCLKLIECLTTSKKYTDALVVCCYAFLQPRLNRHDKTSAFQSLIYYCAIRAKCWSVAFEFVRWFHTYISSSGTYYTTDQLSRDVLYKRIFNAMNFVFVNSQNVAYHRYIMRALLKQKDNHALQTISGNNSLITGTYRHALGEYLRVWSNNRKNPLICLLLALTFTHMACKKDLSSRHLIAIRGIAFMKKYSKVRTVAQEVNYNIARMFHQMSLLPLAKHYYEKVLQDEPPKVFTTDSEGNESCTRSLRYDLRRMAAHNLALIYRASGNDYAAREIYAEHLVI